jgi:death on curing protein
VVHERVIAKFGGPLGVRDKGLLESALYRPQTGYYDDIAQIAAAMFESLLMNHPFIDGNKRVAFFATDVFLRLNGWRFDVDDDTAHGFLLGLLDRGDCDLRALTPWVRRSITKLAE